jgi:HAMP domain-containing protein
MKGRLISFDCTSCGNKIDVKKAVVEPGPEPVVPLEEAPAPQPVALEEIEPAAEPKTKEKRAVSKGLRIGLRAKMFILVFFIPLIALFVAGFLALDEMNKSTGKIISAGSKPALYVAKREINMAAGEIAKQAEIYLSQHAELTPDNVSGDPGLRRIILRPVLQSGQASLYMRFGEKEGTFVIDRESSLEGQPISKVVTKGRLGGARYDELGKVVRLGQRREHREATSFFLAKDPDGILKEKVVTYSPVKGTPYGVMATTYTDDFMEPVKDLEDQVANLFDKVKITVFGLMGIAFLISGFIIFIYTILLTGRIKALTDVANHISLGELGVEADIRSNDEIGDLSAAISRMQDSLILSIERLRKRGR